MTLAALHNVPLLATTFTEILFRRIHASMRAQLGVPDPPAPDDQLGWAAAYQQVRRRLQGLIELIDPSDLPKNRRLPPEEFDAAVRANRADGALTDDVLDVRRGRLAWVANALIEAGIGMVPPEVQAQWTGSAAVDATPIPAFARAERRNRTGRNGERDIVEYFADPDAGYYVRATGEPGIGRDARKTRWIDWAYEATLIVAGNDTPHRDHPYPNLVVGMAPLHPPGTKVGSNALIALASVADRNHPARWLAGDRAYSNQQPEHFQLPARALGYRLIFDYRSDQLGVQASHNGALQIEGGWYCPAIPETLKNATIDYRASKIDEATWRNRIEARRAFRLRPKASPDVDGCVRLLCPAADGAPTGRCELKPNSIATTDTRTRRIPVTDAQRKQPPVVCRQQSSTFPPEAGAKFIQDLDYGSQEWSTRYATLRNAVEGANGVIKDGASTALADPSRRRIRGVAAQTLFVALSICAANIRTIRSFLRHAQPDSHGTLRRPRKRRRTHRSIREWAPRPTARSGAPPAS